MAGAVTVSAWGGTSAHFCGVAMSVLVLDGEKLTESSRRWRMPFVPLALAKATWTLSLGLRAAEAPSGASVMCSGPDPGNSTTSTA
jgi:hypothetical protein